MPTVSNFCTDRSRIAVAAGLAGALSGGWCGILLHGLALRSGGQGPALPLVIILALAGGALAVLLDRLLDWAWRDQEDRRAWWGSLLPWGWALVGAGFLAVPFPHDPAPGTPLGLYKHLLAMLWMGGILLYALPLLTPVWRHSRSRRATWLLAALALLIAPAPVLNPPSESDEGDYVVAALAWARSGTPRVADVVADGTLDTFYFGHTPANWWEYAEQQRQDPAAVAQFSFRMPVYPLLLAPFITAALQLETPVLRWILSSIPGLLSFALLVAALAKLCAPYHARGWALLGLATATPFLYYTTNVQPEILMAALIAWAFVLGRDPATRVRGAAIAILSCLTHERLIIIAAPLVAWMFLVDRAQRRLILGISAACMVTVLAAWLATQQFALPSQLPHAYADTRFAFFAPDRWFRASWMHLFSHQIGLLPHIPVFAAVPLAAYRAWRMRGPLPPREVWIGVGVFACYYAVLITYPHTFDSWPHLRYLIPVLPLLAPLLAWSCSILWERRSDRLVLVGLLAVQSLRAWPFLAVPQLWRAIGLWF